MRDFVPLAAGGVLPGDNSDEPLDSGSRGAGSLRELPRKVPYATATDAAAGRVGLFTGPPFDKLSVVAAEPGATGDTVTAAAGEEPLDDGPLNAGTAWMLGGAGFCCIWGGDNPGCWAAGGLKVAVGGGVTLGDSSSSVLGRRCSFKMASSRTKERTKLSLSSFSPGAGSPRLVINVRKSAQSSFWYGLVSNISRETET